MQDWVCEMSVTCPGHAMRQRSRHTWLMGLCAVLQRRRRW